MVTGILGFRAKEIGISFGSLPVQLTMALPGLLFGVLEYLILTPQSLVAELSFQEVWLPALIILMSTGVVERLICRGVLQRTAVRVFGNWSGIIYVSWLFTVMHIGFLSVIDVVFVFVVSFLWLGS